VIRHHLRMSLVAFRRDTEDPEIVNIFRDAQRFAKIAIEVLDEPTNHLEIEAQEALEGTLRSYPGTVIAVSHDRAFLEALGEQAKVIELPFCALNEAFVTVPLHRVSD
jgi:ABC-type bacteriocin/lantibiotic exporter with double-glycine peptidase domain